MGEVNENKEIREWLGLAPADIPFWLATAVLVWMWFSGSATLALVLGLVAFALSLVACFIGMRSDEDLSNLANLAKKYGYPVGVLLVVGAAVAIYYIRWI